MHIFALWLTIGQVTNAAGVKITDKSCLIMDECDGMSSGDRGGIGALVSLIKKTKVSRRYGCLSIWLTRFSDPNHLYRQRQGRTKNEATSRKRVQSTFQEVQELAMNLYSDIDF
jgi:hypothetical protein